MLTVDYEKCTGCGACVQRCPKRCISWTQREFGFRYPQIDKDACVNCGLCEKVCPTDKALEVPVEQKVYAAVHKDTEVLAKSTSGGAFTAIADAIFAQGGIVYGAAMLDDMQVKHIRTTGKDDFEGLRSSKYLQSDTGTTYQMVEQDLKQGKFVLYSGTPCQIDGLKNFLGKDYETLYTVDIVCHGVGSQAYFDKYMDFARERYGKIKALRFRSKEYAGWSCGGGVVVVDSSDCLKKIPYRDFDNYYYSYFLSGDIYRKSCYSCKYANTNRVGDFTLGDYWGVEALNLPLQTENGCSLLLVNNQHAMQLLDEIESLDRVETTVEQAAHCNKQLNAPSKLMDSRQNRIGEYESMSGQQIQKEYLKNHRKTVVKGQLKALMPYKLKLLIRSARK
jgi:coenzyme F420-reducing hydrogenase beta subunit